MFQNFFESLTGEFVVRSLISVIMLLAAVYLWINVGDVPETMSNILLFALGYWFGAELPAAQARAVRALNR